MPIAQNWLHPGREAHRLCSYRTAKSFDCRSPFTPLAGRVAATFEQSRTLGSLQSTRLGTLLLQLEQPASWVADDDDGKLSDCADQRCPDGLADHHRRGQCQDSQGDAGEFGRIESKEAAYDDRRCQSEDRGQGLFVRCRFRADLSFVVIVNRRTASS